MIADAAKYNELKAALAGTNIAVAAGASAVVEAAAAPADLAEIVAEVVAEARNFDLAVLHTSTPSFASDVRAIAALKAANPTLRVGLIGAKAAVDPEGTLKSAPVVDFAARNEFDFTIKEVAEGRDWKSILGLSFRDANGKIQHTPDRPVLENMDELPFVTPVYKRDLQISRYFIGYLRHPYISIYTGRGCKSRSSRTLTRICWRFVGRARRCQPISTCWVSRRFACCRKSSSTSCSKARLPLSARLSCDCMESWTVSWDCRSSKRGRVIGTCRSR